MIISQERNFIFVHIPKTGGTSMAVALEDKAKPDDILIGDTPKAQRRKHRLKGVQSSGRLWKHSTLRDIPGLVSPAFIEEAYIFTLVRNPWDRMVSYYHWLKAQSFDHPAVHLAAELPFPAFLRHPVNARALKANPYRSYVTDTGGVMRANHFVRLEHLEEDLAPVEAQLGLRLRVGHLNASKGREPYQRHYNADDSAFLGALCAEDIAFFRYSFNSS